MKSEVTDPVDYVFERLAATYGAAWDRALGQTPIVDVKTVWADCLSSFLHSDDAKRAILWALKNLPERVVNAIEFRNLCRMAPARQNQEVLPAPAADPVRVAAELAKLGQVRSRQLAAAPGMKDWAYCLKARHDAGEKLGMYQVSSYQAAIGGATA